MEKLTENPILDLILMHIVFAIPTALILVIFQDVAISARLLIVVILYNILLPLWSHFRDHKEWLEIWMFVLPLSILMIFPDWFLAAQLNVQQFPIDGFPMIGAIPIYMAGLWAIPLFLIVFTGVEVEKRRDVRVGLLAVVLISLLLFGGSEETLWVLGSWSAVNVVGMLDHVALYIIIPEILLGLTAFLGFKYIRSKKVWLRLLESVSIMIFYLGNATFFYFVIEKLVLGA